MNNNTPHSNARKFDIETVKEARHIFENYEKSITETLRYIKNKYRLSCKELGRLLDDAYDDEDEEVFTFHDYGAVMQWCHLDKFDEKMESYINDRLDYLRKRARTDRSE